MGNFCWREIGVEGLVLLIFNPNWFCSAVHQMVLQTVIAVEELEMIKKIN